MVNSQMVEGYVAWRAQQVGNQSNLQWSSQMVEGYVAWSTQQVGNQSDRQWNGE